MPQMMPMMWSFTIIYTFSCMLTIMYFTYFFKSMLPSRLSNKFKMNLNHWIWEW